MFQLDTSLYDHFNETLWSEISEYGLDEIEYEKKNYESQLSRVRTICRDILLESDREFCAEINLSDLDILKAVKESQRELWYYFNIQLCCSIFMFLHFQFAYNFWFLYYSWHWNALLRWQLIRFPELHNSSMEILFLQKWKVIHSGLLVLIVFALRNAERNAKRINQTIRIHIGRYSFMVHTKRFGLMNQTWGHSKKTDHH